jgi:APA family basic amino acid/polyamine antiporter
MDVSTGSWTSISGVTLISAISAALVGSMFSSVKEGNLIAGEIKTVMRWSKFISTLIVSCIYIIANFMYLAVVPCRKIATAESDRAAVASQSLFSRNFTDRV